MAGPTDGVDYPSDLDLTGRGFVVLGAGGGGMGSETSLALSQAGAQLLCVDFRTDQAEEIAALTGGTPHVADIMSRSAMEAVFRRAEDLFGAGFAGVVDIVGMCQMGPLASFGDEAIDQQFQTVFRHALLTVQIAGPMLARLGGGSIVFIGSLAGVYALENQGLYAVAKAAQHHLIKQACYEFGPSGVRFNGIAPGFVRTPRLERTVSPMQWATIAQDIPLRRVGDPSDIARVALFLCSGMACYVTGNIMLLDGGRSSFIGVPTFPQNSYGDTGPAR